jgi:hypothetical protein
VLLSLSRTLASTVANGWYTRAFHHTIVVGHTKNLQDFRFRGLRVHMAHSEALTIPAVVSSLPSAYLDPSTRPIPVLVEGVCELDKFFSESGQCPAISNLSFQHCLQFVKIGEHSAGLLYKEWSQSTPAWYGAAGSELSPVPVLRAVPNGSPSIRTTQDRYHAGPDIRSALDAMNSKGLLPRPVVEWFSHIVRFECCPSPDSEPPVVGIVPRLVLLVGVPAVLTALTHSSPLLPCPTSVSR